MFAVGRVHVGEVGVPVQAEERGQVVVGQVSSRTADQPRAAAA